MFNTADAEHATRVLNVDIDPLIQAAKISMGVDKDEEVKKTLAWLTFRFPLSWVEAEERQREATKLKTQEKESDLDQMPTSDGVTTPTGAFFFFGFTTCYPVLSGLLG